MSSNYSIRKDLSEVKQMVDALEHYLRGDEVYGNVGGLFGSGNMPRLTVGMILLRLRRLEALKDEMKDSQHEKLDSVQQAFDVVRGEWSSFYNDKMLKEANSRLELIKQYFQECMENPSMCASGYKPEALRRTVVQELLHEMEERHIESAELRSKVAEADGYLRQYADQTGFIWSDVLEAVYPEADYWWLHRFPA